MGGIRHVNGFPGEAPPRMHISLGDSLAGRFAAQGILSALYWRDACGGGLGQVVDVSLMESAFALLESTVPEYDRLGGTFAIAAVVDHFSDAVVQNPIVGQKSENPDLREWHTNNLGRLPGLEFMRTLWVCNISGGPQQYVATVPGSTPLGLEEAHRELKISPAEFDEVAAELARTLDVFNVPEREKGEVLGAFAAHKGEVTQGYTQ